MYLLNLFPKSTIINFENKLTYRNTPLDFGQIYK